MTDAVTAADRIAVDPRQGEERRSVEPPQREERRSIDVVGLVERYALLALFIGVVIAFSIAHPDLFPTVANARTIATGRAVVVIAALATIVPLTGGQFDISVGPVIGLSSVGAAAAMAEGLPLAVAVAVGLLLGITVGVVNGVLVAKFGVNSLIATLATSTVIAGVIQWYTDGQSIVSGISSQLTSFGSATLLGIPSLVLAVAAIAGLVWYLQRETPYGRYLESVGENPIAARLVGLSVDRLVLLSFVLSGLLAAAAGILLLAQAGIGNPQNGPNFTLPALAAAFLGATAIRPGRFNVAGTVIAVYFSATILNGLALSGAPPWVEPVFNGTALAVAVSISTLIARRRAGNAVV